MGGGLNGIYDPDFYAYQIGHPAAPLAKVDFGGTSNTVPSRGVAISPDGSVAFVISGYLGAPVYLNLVAIPVPGAPSPATGVTATAGYASATVSWTPPANVGNSPITKYTVTPYIGSTAQTPVTVTGSPPVTTATVSGLTNGTAYTFTVSDTNAVGIVRVTEAALPLLRKSANPVVVNVSSALGSFWAVTNPDRPAFNVHAIVYGASKAAVSMLTLQYAKAVPEIKFNAVEPGYTATDLGGSTTGGRPVEISARAVVRMATITADGPTGTFQEDDAVLPW